MCKQELNEFLFSGVLLPFVISVVVLLTVKVFNTVWFLKTYRNLNNRTFQAFWKNEIDGSPVLEYTLKINSNSITYTGIHLSEKNSTFEGKIKFEPNMKGYGKGYSIKKTENIDGFNFFSIFFENDFKKAYQEAPYVKSPKDVIDRDFIPEAFVWKIKEDIITKQK